MFNMENLEQHFIQIQKYINLFEYKYELITNEYTMTKIIVTTDDNIFTSLFMNYLLQYCNKNNMIFSIVYNKHNKKTEIRIRENYL
jgi:hypothetical protein